MTRGSPNADPHAERRKPWQFTLRALFVVVVVFSLFLSAAKSLEEPLRPLVLALLTWGSLGALYVRFRAIAPLIALGIGAGILAGLWGNVAMVSPTILEVPSALDVLTAALTWGAGLSVFVMIVGWTGSLAAFVGGKWRRRSPQRQASDREPGFSVRSSRLAAGLAVAHTILVLGLLPLFLTGHKSVEQGALVVVFCVDFPLYPFWHVIQEGMPGLGWGFRFHFFPSDVSWIAIATGSALVGGILYAGVGWLIGYLAEIIHSWRPPRRLTLCENREGSRLNEHDSSVKIRGLPSRF